MPTLDVSDLIFDPDWQQTITVRRGVLVNTAGTGSVTYAPDQPIVAVVVPHDGFQLERLADAEYDKDKIDVFSRFPLTSGEGPDETADIVIWHSRLYTVTDVENWTDYGAGFVKAVCELISVSNEPG